MAPFVLELAPVVGLVAACAALAVSRATFYRRQLPPRRRAPRPPPPRALPVAERAEVLEVLNSRRFADKAPAQVYADLLDDEKYLCSVRTMYRILDASGEVRERRDQLRHAGYTKPELLATAPTRSGRGTSPSSRDRPRGRTTPSTSSSTSSAAISSAG